MWLFDVYDIDILMAWKIRMTHDVYRSEDCMSKFCEYLKEHEMKLINFKTKKLIPLRNKEQESNASEEIPHLQKRFENKYADDKKYSKV